MTSDNNIPANAQFVSTSGNVLSGQQAFLNYNESENNLEAYDAELLEEITNAQTTDSTTCEDEWNAPTNPAVPNQNNYIYQLENNTDSSDSNGLSAEYTDASAQLNERNTVRTSQTQMYQQIMGQFPNNQSSLYQTMASGRGIQDTLTQIISSWRS